MSREPSTSGMELSDEDTDAQPRDADTNSEADERKIKAAAKTNRKVCFCCAYTQSVSPFSFCIRPDHDLGLNSDIPFLLPKIADLEITNRSLMAINVTLEATKHRQAKEIRELRRKLRESRLILPPPAYRAVKSSLTPEDLADEEDDEEEEEEEDEDDSGILGDKADEAYRRVRSVIDTLLKSGRAALESKPEDFVGTGKGGAKVLTAEEVRTWRGDDDNTETRSNFGTDADSIFASSRPLSPSRVAVPDGNDGLESEDEVEASLIEPDTPPPLPPIRITSSF